MQSSSPSGCSADIPQPRALLRYGRVQAPRNAPDRAGNQTVVAFLPLAVLPMMQQGLHPAQSARVLPPSVPRVGRTATGKGPRGRVERCIPCVAPRPSSQSAPRSRTRPFAAPVANTDGAVGRGIGLAAQGSTVAGGISGSRRIASVHSATTSWNCPDSGIAPSGSGAA